MTEPAVGNRRRRIALLIAGGVLWFVVFAVLYWIWQQRQQSLAEIDRETLLPQPSVVFHPWEVTDFKLTECRGGVVRKADLMGRPWVASFIFTRCRGACPRVAAQLRLLKDRIGKTDVRLVTFTVDPDHDTRDVLKRYAAELQADPERWLFLTGKQDDVYRLIKNGFHLPVAQRTGDDRKPGDEVAHSQSVLLVDARGYVVGKFDGTSEVEMAKLERAIRRLRDNGSSTKGKPGNG